MILHYPIPNKNCVIGSELKKDIVHIMHKVLSALLNHLLAIRFLTNQSLLVNLIMKSITCTTLIKDNQTFTQSQIEYVWIHTNLLKFRFNRMREDFDDSILLQL